MRKIKLFSTVIVCSVLILTGCKKDIEQTKSPLLSDQLTAPSKANLTAAQKERLQQIRASLPAGSESRLQINSQFRQKVDPQYREMIRQKFAVTPTPCNQNTPFNSWLNNELADWDNEVFYYASVTGMLDFPTYDAFLFANTSAGVYFGANGEYTQKLNKSYKDIRRFWNIETDELVFTAMHGNMLQDRERIIRIDMILYGDTRPVAEFWADLILELLTIFPQYRNGTHPIFTFNAFALEGFPFPLGDVPSKIVMGDGIMEAYTGIGYGDVAPQAIMAHELGHHIQFQLNLFPPTSSPEGTRRTELMADAYSSYFLSHARGQSMQWKRVQQFLAVFFNIGDCA
ncbi:MAG: hypothetical protein ACXWV4_12940, partial [Flavitalea sp.]